MTDSKLKKTKDSKCPGCYKEYLMRGEYICNNCLRLIRIGHILESETPKELKCYYDKIYPLSYKARGFHQHSHCENLSKYFHNLLNAIQKPYSNTIRNSADEIVKGSHTHSNFTINLFENERNAFSDLYLEVSRMLQYCYDEGLADSKGTLEFAKEMQNKLNTLFKDLDYKKQIESKN